MLPSNRNDFEELAPASAASRALAFICFCSCFSIVTVLIQSVVLQRVRKLAHFASEMKRTNTQKASDSSLFSMHCAKLDRASHPARISIFIGSGRFGTSQDAPDLKAHV